MLLRARFYCEDFLMLSIISQVGALFPEILSNADWEMSGGQCMESILTGAPVLYYWWGLFKVLLAVSLVEIFLGMDLLEL